MFWFCDLKTPAWDVQDWRRQQHLFVLTLTVKLYTFGLTQKCTLLFSVINWLWICSSLPTLLAAKCVCFFYNQHGYCLLTRVIFHYLLSKKDNYIKVKHSLTHSLTCLHSPPQNELLLAPYYPRIFTILAIFCFIMLSLFHAILALAWLFSALTQQELYLGKVPYWEPIGDVGAAWRQIRWT